MYNLGMRETGLPSPLFVPLVGGEERSGSNKDKKRTLQSRTWSQVGFAKLRGRSNDRANIGGTIIGAPIIGQ